MVPFIGFLHAFINLDHTVYFTIQCNRPFVTVTHMYSKTPNCAITLQPLWDGIESALLET